MPSQDTYSVIGSTSSVQSESVKHQTWNPLFDLLQALEWIALTGSHELQKYPLEVVYATPAAVSANAQPYATSVGNSRKLFYDAYGKYIVVYRSTNQIRLAYSNTSPPSTWTDIALSNPVVQSTDGCNGCQPTGVAVAYSSIVDGLMVVWPTTTVMDAEQVIFARDASHNISGITEGTVLSITPTLTGTAAVPFNPSLWMLHNGEVALVFGADTTGTPIKGAVVFCRLAFGNPPTYKNAAGTSGAVDVISSIYSASNTFHFPTIVERVNAGTGQYDLYAFWCAYSPSPPIDVSSRQAKATWSSPNWSWSAEAASTAAINGPPTASYDSSAGLIVYASAAVAATSARIDVGTINANDVGQDISATGLTSLTYPRIRSSPSFAIGGGNYYVFYALASSTCSTGSWGSDTNSCGSGTLYYLVRSGGATGNWGTETSFTSTAAEAYPSTKIDAAGGAIDVVWTHYTGTAYNVYYDHIVLFVTQPITLTPSWGSAPAGTFTLSGCSVSPTAIVGDGASHSVTATPSCSLTVTVPTDGANTRDRFIGPSTSWVFITCATGTCSSQSNTYYYQYGQTLSYSVSGGGTPTAPTFTSLSAGVSTPNVLTTSGTIYWYDGGASWSTTNPLGGSTGSEQWATSQATSGTITSAQTITWTYFNQYMLTMTTGTGGSVTPASGWQNSGTNATLTATPSGGYTFASWSCTGTGCYSGTANPSWVIISAAMTETGNFNQIVVTIRVDNRTLATSSGGANMTSPQTVSPTVEYWYGIGAYDSQSTNDVQSLTIDVYRTGHAPGSFAKSFVYSFRWVANGWGGTPSCSTSPGCWQELQNSGWVPTGFNYLIQSDSSITAISGSALTAKWQFAIKLDQLAAYTTNGAGLWNFKGTVVSKSTGNPTGTRAGTFDVNLLVSVTVPGNMNWGTVAAGSLNVTAFGMPVYTTYSANAIVTITIYGGGDPVSQYGDTFPLSSIYVAKTSNPANNDGVVMSTSPATLYGSLPVASNSNLAMYWFISTPSPFTPGTYTFTYYEVIQLQSMQS